MGNKTKDKAVSWRGSLFRDTQAGVVYPVALVADLRHYGYQRTGTNNPKYRVIIAQGKNATGAMNVVVQNGETTDCSYTLSKRGSSDPRNPEFWRIYESGMSGVHLSLNMPGPIPAHYDLSGVSMDKACAGAKRIVHKRLTARRRNFQGGVAAIELKKTLQMVIRPAKALRQQIAVASRRIPKIMKSLKRSGASRQSKAKVLADTYLEWTFGWQPLLLDTQEGAVALARLATRDALERQQFRGYDSDFKSLPSTFGNDYRVGYDLASQVSFDREWRQSVLAECIIYGRFQTRLQDSSYAKSTSLRLAELCGFTFADFLPTAWEAMPWSFLVDYFANVGDVIEAFSNNIGEIAWAAEVHITESKEDFISVLNQAKTASLQGGLFYGVSGQQTHAKSTRKTIERATGAQLDLSVSLRLSLPEGLQWLNIGALAVGARPPKPFY
jgi:hypothetical protein